MALVKQNVPIIFGQGIDTKVDPRQQMLTTFRKAKNVVYETLYSIKKRFGYDRILLRTNIDTPITQAQGITTFKDELDIFASNTLYSYSEVTERLTEKGPVYPVLPTSVPVLNAALSHTHADMDYVDGLEVYAFANSAGEIRYSIRDVQNNSFLVSNDLVASGSRPKVSSINGDIYIFYVSGTSLNYRRTSISTIGTLQAAVPVSGSMSVTTPVFDVAYTQGKIFVVYNSSVISGYVRVVSINSDGSLSSGFGITGSPEAVCISVVVDLGTKIVISYASTTDLYYAVADYPLSSLFLPETLIESIADVKNIGMTVAVGDDYTFWYEVGVASVRDHYIKVAIRNFSGAVVQAPSVFVRSLGLLAKPYKIEEASYVPCVFGPDIQSTGFVLDENAAVVAKFSNGLSAGVQTNGALAQTPLISSMQVIIPTRYKTRTEAENNTFFSVFGITSTKLVHNNPTPLQTAVLGDNLHIAGGILRAYDGDEVVELGFNMYPDTIVAGSQSAAGGFMSNGNYGYVAVYKWTDNYGQEHRSAASANLDVVQAAGGATQSGQIVVPTLRVTDKSTVQIELYRTENNGTIYYLTASTLNSTSVDTVTLTDTLSDTTLISKLPLYTTGDVLDNGPAPSAQVLGVHTASNRLMAISEDKNLLIYSKIRQQGGPVEWNEALAMTLDPVGGDVTAIVSMDEKAIIFKNDAILFISGSGPNNLGQQDNFTLPERVATDIGCIEPSSIVLISQGLMFKSRKGIYLLSRSLGLDYIGSAVEEYNNEVITSAEIVAKYNQVRFTTQTGECLVYNYHLQLWSTFDNHAALSAKVVKGTYYYVRSGSEIFRESPTKFSDNGSPINIFVETGWMSFSKMQGMQRVYRMLILGSWKSSHMLRIRAAYDFNTAWVHEKVLNPVPDVVSGVAYGNSSPYGNEAFYGGDGDVYQARFDFKKQKCQSFRLQFQEQQLTAGEGLSLSAFTLEVGGKQGLFKPRQSKIKGLA